MQTCFHIADGRTCFYQWDINRKMIVTDESIKELHFCNGTSDCSLVCTVVDGVADVPNILLQTAVNINIYGFTGDHTEIKKIYSVLPRTRPADYVYTETEIKRYETLENRIKALEDSGPPQDGIDAEPVPDGEVIALMAENDLMLAVMDESGILADENGNILEW